MAKRGADRQLTDSNYLQDSDDNDGHEDKFSIADEQTLKNRVIRKAKRGRNASSLDSNQEPSGGGAFKLFGGFQSKNSVSIVNFDPALVESRNFNVPAAAPKEPKITNSAITSKFGPPFMTTERQQPSGDENKYHKKIASLNRSFLKHIQNNLDDNVLVDLSPLFPEYTQYMKDIEKERNKTSNISSTLKAPISSSSSNVEAKINIAKTNFSFVPTTSASTSSLPATTGFSVSNFRFASNTSTSAPSSDGNKLSAIPATTSSSTSNATSGSVGEEFAPEGFLPQPKAVVTEDDAIFSARCKLFYKLKKDDSDWKERGVGTVYLKNAETSGMQMIIRNDSSLGNILLNIVVSKTTPMSIVKEKNISFVAVANPPIDLKNVSKDPTTFLMRLKVAADATSLYDHVKESA